MCKEKIIILLFAFSGIAFQLFADDNKFTIDDDFGFYVDASTLGFTPEAGDTILISSLRTKSLKFIGITGDSISPIVIENSGGQVNIVDTQWGGLVFENCRYLKISGKGHPGFKYGFRLNANQCGLAFTELSSDCEAENIHIDHLGFFGIYAKKDYGGNPPSPVPVFENLSIHDCLIENVTEGMYLGETKTPGMEFKKVKIYNNIVRNTGRESVQIANMTEDVEIYNNTFLNAGLDSEYAQNNILQIGDNSSANVYDNLLVGARGWGIISFGNGNNHFIHNYIADSRGIFIDNRTVTIDEDSVIIEANYFKNTSYDYLIKSLNEINFHLIKDNQYDSISSFFNDSYHNDENFLLLDNQEKSIAEIYFENEDSSNFALAESSSEEFSGMGAPGGAIYFPYVQTESLIESSQIVLSSSMIVDEVFGGSYYSPEFLVDEQSLTPDNDSHPDSESWKPAYNMDESPFHVYIDLQHLYHITKLAIHDMNNSKNLVISVGEPGNWVELLVDSCNLYNKWKAHDVSVDTRYIRLSMFESIYAAINELEVFGYALETQIVLNESMMIDEVSGGSYYSPNFLIDEQESSPDLEIHPVSKSWKPYWNMDKAPYSVVIDLGMSYQLSKIYLHDMHSVANLYLEYGEPDSWNPLFTETCNTFNTWKAHTVDQSTRYLRLSMTESISASVNEIIIYGLPDPEADLLKGQTVQYETSEEEAEEAVLEGSFVVYPNIIKDKLNLRVLGAYANNFKIEIYRLSGKLVYSKYFTSIDQIVLTIDTSHFMKGNYIVSYSNDDGGAESLRINKIN
jgi:hypothetical protein